VVDLPGRFRPKWGRFSTDVDIDEGGSHPVLDQQSAAPALHVAKVARDTAVEVFDRVGGRQPSPHGAVQVDRPRDPKQQPLNHQARWPGGDPVNNHRNIEIRDSGFSS